MSRNNIEGARIDNSQLGQGIKGIPLVVALGAAMTFDGDAGFVSFIDPGGATRVVTLPDPTSVAEKDTVRIIVNTADAAEDLTINDPAATTRGTISQNEFAIILCDGVRHYVGVMTTT
jgi:hypothetical protein